MPQNRLLRPSAALALALLCLPALSCRREPPRPRNVIFILVDTLRADHVSAWGYGRPTSPNLDALAREGVRFADARSQASCTFPSANSVLTSRWPAVFLGQPDGAIGIPAGVPSLAEILHARGFRTVAVSASPIVRQHPSRFNPKGGFDRGFDAFKDGCVWKPAECVNEKAFEYLQGDKPQGDKPLFLYLHYLDPHGAYHPPPPWRHRFTSVQTDKEWVLKGEPNPIGDWLYKGAPDPGATPRDLQYLKDLYDGEIGYFDSQLAELLAALRRTGLLDTSIVVLTADHGEEFLEHGDIKHCRNLFDTTIHIPMLLRIPGTAPRTVSRPVQNLDLVPTILDYLGVDAKRYRFEGRSLRSVIEGGGEGKATEAGELQYSLIGDLRSVSDGRFKLVESLAGGTPPALYDLRADPGETKDVLAVERRAYARLRAALDAWLARQEGKDAADASREAQKRLRSLGYIE